MSESKNIFIEQTKHGARCYCSHEMGDHRHYRKNCNLCICELFERLPFDFFNRCPKEYCNSGEYFLPDTSREDVFICYACESAYQFDGFESFNELTDAELKQLLESTVVVDTIPPQVKNTAVSL